MICATGSSGIGTAPRDWVIAAATGILFIAVAFVGADKPPPPGFAVVAIMAAALTALVAFALPRWRTTKALPERGKAPGPAVQGALVGTALWAAAVLLPFTGEPTINPGFADYVIGAALAASLGAVVAALLARLA
jgi:hypothetical protein